VIHMAIILLAHGSPDPDWMSPIERTAARARELAPGVQVRIATLDPTHGSLREVVDELAAAGHHHLEIIALFLSPGGRHIKRDIPELVAQIQADRPHLTLHLIPGAIGTEARVIDALACAAVELAGVRPPPI